MEWDIFVTEPSEAWSKRGFLYPKGFKTFTQKWAKVDTEQPPTKAGMMVFCGVERPKGDHRPHNYWCSIRATAARPRAGTEEKMMMKEQERAFPLQDFWKKKIYFSIENRRRSPQHPPPFRKKGRCQSILWADRNLYTIRIFEIWKNAKMIIPKTKI